MASNFNYDTSKEQIDRQRALAQRLFNTQLPQATNGGGPGGGFTIAPSKFASLAGLLTQLTGAYGMGKADDAQRGLDQQSIDSINAAMQNDPMTQARADAVNKQQQSESAAEMLRESRRGQGSGVDAGDTVDTGLASAMPVTPQPPNNMQPLPASPVPQQAPAAPQGPALAQALMGAGGGRGSQGGPTAQELAAYQAQNAPINPNINPAINPDDPLGNAGSFKDMAGRVMKGIGSLYSFDHSPTAAPAQVAPPAQAAPVAPQTAPAAPQIAPTAPPQAAPVPQAPPTAPVDPAQSTSARLAALLNPNASAGPGQAVTNSGQTVQLSDPRMMTDQAADAARPTQQQSINQVLALANSGPMGKVMANAKFQQMFAAPEYDFKTVKQGDSDVLVAVNKRNPNDVRQIVGASGQPSMEAQRLDFDKKKFATEQGDKQAKTDASQGSAYAMAQRNIDQLDTVLSPAHGDPSLSNGTGYWGALMNQFPGSDSRTIHNRVETAVNSTVLATMQALNQGGTGVSAFNSDAEGARLQNSIAKINWYGPESELRNQLMGIQQQQKDAIARLNDARVKQGLTPMGQSPQPAAGASPTGAVPTRGQQVSAAAYGF